MPDAANCRQLSNFIFKFPISKDYGMLQEEMHKKCWLENFKETTCEVNA
jgi:hypothetical protein